MTISRNVYNQLFEQAPDAATGAAKEKVIRLRPTEAKAGAVVMSAKSKIQMWTKEEHERFLAALEKFPAGPWKKVADFIGTKTPRQTMTHAQKYRQKIHRRQRGLRNQKKSGNAAAAAATPATGSEGNPTPVDTAAAMKGEPKAIVSPYGVADLLLKPGSEAAAAAAAGATNDQLLNILAQQATTINDKPEPMEVDSDATVEEGAEKIAAEAEATPEDAAEGSPNPNLPSLAEILHLSGDVPADEKAQSPNKSEDEAEKKTEAVAADKTETPEAEKPKDEKETDKEQTRPEECKCNCKCSAHDGQKPVADETTTQPRPEEI